MSSKAKYQARWKCCQCGREFVEPIDEQELLFWVGIETPPICLDCDPTAGEQIEYYPAQGAADVLASA